MGLAVAYFLVASVSVIGTIQCISFTDHKCTVCCKGNIVVKTIIKLTAWL